MDGIRYDPALGFLHKARCGTQHDLVVGIVDDLVLRQVTVPEGKTHSEGAALALCAGRADLAAVELDELRNEGEI